MCVLKDAGWTICINNVSGKVTIYRQGEPGAIEIPIVQGALHVRIVDENESIAESITVKTEHLGRN